MVDTHIYGKKPRDRSLKSCQILWHSTRADLHFSVLLAGVLLYSLTGSSSRQITFPCSSWIGYGKVSIPIDIVEQFSQTTEKRRINIPRHVRCQMDKHPCKSQPLPKYTPWLYSMSCQLLPIHICDRCGRATLSASLYRFGYIQAWSSSRDRSGSPAGNMS